MRDIVNLLTCWKGPRVRLFDMFLFFSLSTHTRTYTTATLPSLITKTSLMLGVGETDEEIRATLHDLRNSDVDVVTFGQYLRPTKRHMKVKEYVTPEKFQAWQEEAESMGFKYVASGPLVRSSYKAGEFFLENMIREKQKKEAASSS